MLEFIRSDLAQLASYSTQHTDDSQAETTQLDRLDVNENPYDMPEALKQKLAFTWQNTIESNRYPDGGYLDLKDAIAQYVSESVSESSNATFNRDQITVGNGSDELIRSVLIATCLNGAGSILVANPTFSMYGILAQTLGISVVSIDRALDSFEMDLEAADRAIASNNIRVVFVVHPNSPTGNALSEKEIQWLRQLPQNILVVVDEAYFEFSRTTLADELAQHPNWIVMRTFSKAFRLAAHRVGYAIAHPELIATLEKVRLPYNLPSFSIAAAQVALSERHALLTVVDELLTERAKLEAALSAHAALQVWHSDSNFLHVRMRNAEHAETNHEKLVKALKQKGTLIRHTGGGLRITVGTPAENQNTCDRMAAVLKTL